MLVRLRERLVGLFRFGADPPAASFGLDIPPDLWNVMTARGAIAPRISRAEALQVPAVLRARNLIAGTIGSLPLVTIGPDRNEVPGTYLLGGNIDPEIPNSVLVAYTLEDLLFEGIAWWRVTRVGWHGYPVEARWVPTSAVHVAPVGPLMPSQMLISPDQPFPVDGQVFIDGIEVSDAEVVRFDSPNPPLLRHAARAIRTALLLDSTAGLYAESPQPLTVFTPRDGADVGTEEEIQQMLDRWDGARARRATGYVGAALNLDTVGWSPEQLQLADARQHAVLEIARATGIDPEDLGVSTTSRTYANAETRRRDLVDFTLSAYISALQDRLSMRDVLPRGYQAKVKLDAFLRSDTKTRMETYKIGLEVGAYTTEEIRVAEDRPALTRSQAPAPLPAPLPPAEEPNMSNDEPAAQFSSDLPDHWEFVVDSPPWGSIDQADYTEEQWRRACLIDTGEGEGKQRYKLPVKTPGGALHRGGVHAAAGGHGLGAVQGISAEKRAAAARALIRLYGEIGDEPPASLRRLAGQTAAAEATHATVTFDDPEVAETFQVDTERRLIVGLAVPWGKVAKSGFSKWRFAPDSLRWSDTSRIKLNLNHERHDLIGRATRLQSGSQGLTATFKVADTTEGRRALALAEDKVLDGFSIEIDFDEQFGDEWQPDPHEESVRFVRQATLRGVALTGNPAFDDARVTRVAASRDHTEGGATDASGEEDRVDQRRPGAPRVRVRSRRFHGEAG